MLLRAIKLLVTILRDTVIVFTMMSLVESIWNSIKSHIENTKRVKELSEEELKELRELKDLLLKYNMLDKVKEMDELCK